MRNPVSRFARVKSDIDLKRSTFDRNSRHLTTMSAGSLYPLYVDEVLPGDTFSVDLSALLRMSTPIHPVMDNCFLDTFWFFVPNRIIWDHFKEFMGESPSDPYLNPIEYSVPQLIGPPFPDRDMPGIAPKSVADYMGIPTGSIPESINALPFRAFSAIWNEWFRDQNLQNSIDFSTGDINASYFRDEFEPDPDEYVYINWTAYGGTLPPVNKYHDYFTSALKDPQKGEDVPIPLSGFAPVYATSMIDLEELNVYRREPNIVTDMDGTVMQGILGVNEGGALSVTNDSFYGDSDVRINNLGADLSNIAGIYSTISDLRYAFQLQKFLEADNRGGTRYREILKQHFGVTSPDASQQIPEFLGGKRIPINIAQVLQTSATDEVSPQGNTAAYSLTSDTYSAFTKSFTEHGYLLCVGCIRTEHTYQQGIERLWNKKSKFDFYFPEFANISDQPIYNREIYNHFAGDPFFGSGAETAYSIAKGVFGFQEPWAEYKYKPNRVSGEFRSTFRQSLDSWHYADDYESQPYLSDGWIRETRNNIDRTLAVQNGFDQFICDFYFKLKTTRCMPLYSIPGLADHH